MAGWLACCPGRRVLSAVNSLRIRTGMSNPRREKERHAETKKFHYSEFLLQAFTLLKTSQ
jgi:hypothetical protein